MTHEHLRIYIAIKLFQFEIIPNVLVSSLYFIWLPMSWIFGHYKLLIILVRRSTLDVRI